MTKRVKTALTVSAAAVSLLLAGWRSAAVVKYMEYTRAGADTNGYYLSDNGETVAFTVTAVVLLAALAAAALFFGKGQTHVFNADHIGTAVASLVCAASFVFVFAVFAVGFAGSGGNPGVFAIITNLFALAAALLFFLRIGVRSGGKKPLSPASLALSALLPAAFCAFRLLSDFISTNAAPTESSGAYHILSLCALLLFFLVDGKSPVRPAKKSLFLAFGFVSAALLLIYAIPNLVLFGLGLLAQDAVASIAGSVLDITVAGYVFARVCAKDASAPEKKLPAQPVPEPETGEEPPESE